jgi:hypothetical protein
MVAYSFQKRFVGHLQAGLEPGPWVPGMKRHTLRLPRRNGHARPEQPVQLYTGMRTRQCRLVGRAVARAQIPVRIYVGDGQPFTLARSDGPAPRSRVAGLAPVVQQLLDMPPHVLLGRDDMEAFARSDGFADAVAMEAFFEVPAAEPGVVWSLEMILVGWEPGA